jgi:hypothetical protein
MWVRWKFRPATAWRGWMCWVRSRRRVLYPFWVRDAKWCVHILTTQYGRDCAATRKPNAINAARPCVKSVFALAQAMNLRT